MKYCTGTSGTYIYRPKTKWREGNVFTDVCMSWWSKYIRCINVKVTWERLLSGPLDIPCTPPAPPPLLDIPSYRPLEQYLAVETETETFPVSTRIIYRLLNAFLFKNVNLCLYFLFTKMLLSYKILA